MENTGAVGGWEVVQAYGTLASSSAARVPLKQLLGFTKVYVPAGARTRAELVIDPAARAVLRRGDLVRVLEPGPIALRVAGSSDPDAFPGTSGAGIKGEVVIVGPAAELEKCT